MKEISVRRYIMSVNEEDECEEIYIKSKRGKL